MQQNNLVAATHNNLALTMLNNLATVIQAHITAGITTAHSICLIVFSGYNVVAAQRRSVSEVRLPPAGWNPDFSDSAVSLLRSGLISSRAALDLEGFQKHRFPSVLYALIIPFASVSQCIKQPGRTGSTYTKFPLSREYVFSCHPILSAYVEDFRLQITSLSSANGRPIHVFAESSTETICDTHPLRRSTMVVISNFFIIFLSNRVGGGAHNRGTQYPLC